MKRPAAEEAAATIIHYLVTSTNIDVMARFTCIEKAMQGLINEAVQKDRVMVIIETGGISIFVDAIAALAPNEWAEGTRIMLISGDNVDSPESIESLLARIKEAMGR